MTAQVGSCLLSPGGARRGRSIPLLPVTVQGSGWRALRGGWGQAPRRLTPLSGHGDVLQGAHP